MTRPDPQSLVPGYAIRYVELEAACAFLVDQGWAGGIGFDEAVRALAPRIRPGIDPGRLAVAMNTAQIRAEEISLGRDLRVVAERVAAAYGADSAGRRSVGRP